MVVLSVCVASLTFANKKWDNWMWLIPNFQCNFRAFRISYVLTVPFWTGSSRFERTAPVLPFLAEVSRFEILAKILDLYELPVDIAYYKLNDKIFAASNKIRCVRWSRLQYSSLAVDPGQPKLKLFCHNQKKCWKGVWELMQFVIVKP